MPADCPVSEGLPPSRYVALLGVGVISGVISGAVSGTPSGESAFFHPGTAWSGLRSLE